MPHNLFNLGIVKCVFSIFLQKTEYWGESGSLHKVYFTQALRTTWDINEHIKRLCHIFNKCIQN